MKYLITKKYKKEIWSKFMKAIRDYQLIEDNDHIAVCLSGGKDSFLMAKCFQEYQNINNNISVAYLLMDPGYSEKTLQIINENIKLFEINVEIFKVPFFSFVEKQKKSPCYLCARMRRGYLYNKAQELGCNKIALGHHFNDVIETTMLSLFYNGEFKTMMPKLHSENFKGLELIRPLYLIHEDTIIKWQNDNNFSFIHCSCPLANKENDSKRKMIKNLIKELKKENKNIEKNIFNSSSNVNLNTIISIVNNNKTKSFLDDYDL